ncbi:MAG: heme-copper oxidase subunit III [Dehalococcoidaceae bacterium]|nr:heme-copper oxidase subunit III [Dehalococcoidaceae bacterium]
MKQKGGILQAQDLPLNLNNRRAPMWLGWVGLIVIEATLFTALITSFFVLRMTSPEWPIGGIQRPELLLPTIGTALLLASSIPAYWADHRGRNGDLRSLRIGLITGLIIIVAFLGLKFYEYSHAGYSWSTNAYGSVVFFIMGFHLSHVIALVLKTIVVLVAAARGYFSKQRSVGIQTNGMYWHFVVVVWLPLYFTLYLSHYIFGIKGG